MKQVVTLFRAEDEQANCLLRSCRNTKKHDLLGLRDRLREQARSTAHLTAYIEFLDGWSMGDDFTRIMGDTVRRKQGRACELYFGLVTQALRGHVQRQAKRKHQFPEQATLARTLANLAEGQFLPDASISLALFREVLGGSVTDDDIREGSNQTLPSSRP